MRSLLSRIISFIKGFLGVRVSELELNHPDYALDSYMERKRKGVVGLFDGVAAISAAIEKQRGLLKDHMDRLVVIERRLESAAKRRDMADGPRLVAEKNRLLENISTTRELLRGQEREQQLMKDQLHDAKLALEHTETERVSLCAQLKYQRAQEVANRALDQVLIAPEDRIMERMRDKVQSGRAKFRLATELNNRPGAQGLNSLSELHAEDFAALCDALEADTNGPKSSLALGAE